MNPLRAHPTGSSSTPPTLDSQRPPLQIFGSSQFEKVEPIPRDIYGFKKISQYVTLEQYDEWNAEYTVYLERRRRKWEVLMKQYGLSTEKPIRFPPKSDKVKRYIRKGLPPDWRGAAWFWYAGGPDKLAREPGLYRQLISKVESGALSEIDQDSIERDLHRTFPDNIKFKPDPEPEHPEFPGRSIGPERSSTKREPRLLGALRRVLQAFAIHNPNIGYCQSLNFLAGLLLLFLDEDEEKSFVLLNILTNTHLPGIHAKLLEANVDVGVLMSCIQESMPAVWVKIDDMEATQPPPSRGRSRSGPAPVGIRLPTVSLATTSWFMSCFLGNMPVESVLRVWDSLFYEGSKTLFRISLAIFKTGENEIRSTREQ
ncbi:RabGAP/TBC, partial [Microthyrium microscopicum]